MVSKKQRGKYMWTIYILIGPLLPDSLSAVAGTTTLTGPGTCTSTAARQTPAMRDVRCRSPAARLCLER